MFFILKHLAIYTSRVMHKIHLFSLVLYIYLLKMFIRILLIGIKHYKQTSPKTLEWDPPIVLSLYPAPSSLFLSVVEWLLMYYFKKAIPCCCYKYFLAPFSFSLSVLSRQSYTVIRHEPDLNNIFKLFWN